MDVLINISAEIYEHAKDGSEDSNDEWNAMRAIANGTPIPDNATNRDVIKTVLDKIRADIAKEIIPRNSEIYDCEAKWLNMGLRMALKVIDKCKAESEEESEKD